MTIADILERGVQVQWHEAIALVRDVIERGAATQPGASFQPEQIELLPSGIVELHEATDAADPAKWDVDLLQMIMGGVIPPGVLGRIMTEPPESLDALSAALADFERPHRDAILQDLYRRADQIPSTSSTDEQIASLRATTLAAAGVEQPPPAASRRRLYYAAGLAVLALVSVAVLLLAGRAGTSDGVPSSLQTVTTGVTAAVGGAVSALGERVGLTHPAPAAPAAAEPAVPAPETSPAAVDRARKTVRRPEGFPQHAVDAITPVAFVKDETAAGGVAGAPLSPLPQVQERVVAPTDEMVYSTASPGVAAPVPVRPQLPREPPPGLRPEDLTRIQLIILPNGQVESVKLLDHPRDVLDSMLLSAAKAWRFRPAMRNGTPVKYRATMSISLARAR